MRLDHAVSEDNANYTLYCDPDLVWACVEGSQLAWNELIARYGRLVYGICRHYQLSPADAESVFIRVFTVVFHQLAYLQHEASLTTWMITTTWQECRPFVRMLSPAPEEIERWHLEHLVHQSLRRHVKS